MVSWPRVLDEVAEIGAETGVLRRGRTAMQRYRVSRPVALALAEGIITRETTVLDYGCGRGGDVRYLGARCAAVEGWDPVHRPKGNRAPADVVNLGYVLNVIEDPRERAHTLRQAFSFARRVLVASVRVDQVPANFTEFGDGHLTGTKTFQKLYTQAEFREYVAEVLGARAHVAGLGTVYVFADEEAESRYLANRAFTRRLEYRADLIEEFRKSAVAKRFVKLTNKLGRVPLAEEFKDFPKFADAFGSPQRIERLVLRTINREAFEGSRAQRREDIVTYLAMLRLQGIKAPPPSVLPASVRSDVRAIWPSYAAAITEATEFLFQIGRPEAVKAACSTAGVGKLLPGDFYIHRSAEDELPALLRLVLSAARNVVGSVEYDIAKIALDGRAVSFLAYESFDEDAHPALQRSLRVYLPRASYGIREYSGYGSPPILHRKETLVARSYPHFEKFLALTESEEAAGLLSNPNIGMREDWLALLKGTGYAIEGHTLVGPEL